MFQHFILTRFNLRKKGWQKTKSHTQVLTDTWMENRLNLFEKFCYASVKAQSNQKFEWLVFFDTTTPAKFRQRIAALAQAFSIFKPIYADGMDDFLPAITREINARLHMPYLITSRLDNDDCLHQDYVMEVQAQFYQQDFMAIDFVDGFTLQVSPHVRFAKHAHVHNPFLSLIEKSDNFKTIWLDERHGYWSNVRQVKPIRKKPMWMSVIHMENKVNKYRGFDEVDLNLIRYFNLHQDTLQNIECNIEPFSTWKRQALWQKLRTRWKVSAKLIKRKLAI